MKFFRYEYKERRSERIEVGYFNLKNVVSVRGCSHAGTLSVKLDGAKTTIEVANAPDVDRLLELLKENS